ncbi:Proliferating cell nuclear antigen [Yarrowia sp. B02]|nr:Proliferating cell nuclear antigen [Yarrowia sp. B02]
MLEAKLNEAALLKKIIDAIKDSVTDVNFECSETGIDVQAVDSSHIALVSLKLGSDGFSDYRCDRNITLGIKVASLVKILRCANDRDALTLMADDNGDQLRLTFEDSKSERVSEFVLKLMTIDQEHLGIPDTKYESDITMPVDAFQKIMRDMFMLSESVKISCDKEGVKFSCKGDVGDGSVLIKPSSSVDDEGSTTIAVETPVSMELNLKYLNNFCKASGLAQNVHLGMSSEVPIMVEYLLPNGYLRFYLAPKIGDDDDEDEDDD